MVPIFDTRPFWIICCPNQAALCSTISGILVPILIPGKKKKGKRGWFSDPILPVVGCPESKRTMFPKMIDLILPSTIAEAVDILLDDLPLLDRSRLACLSQEELDLINRVVGLQIARDFKLWSGNDDLLHDCMEVIEQQGDKDADPTMVIIRAMWTKLQEIHALRLVK